MKNTKIAIYISVVILVFGGLYLMGKQNLQNKPTVEAAPGANAELSAVLASAEKLFDFGTISMAKGKVSKVFEFENSGSAAVTIRQVYTSCMCTAATLVKGSKRVGPFGMPGHGFNPGIRETVNPGEKAALEVVFDPAAHGPAGVGPIQRMVRAETDSGYIDFEIKATVTP